MMTLPSQSNPYEYYRNLKYNAVLIGNYSLTFPYRTVPLHSGQMGTAAPPKRPQLLTNQQGTTF